MQPDGSALVPPAEDSNDALQQAIREQVGPTNFNLWFRGRTTFAMAGDELRLGVGSPFLLSWMQRKFRAEVSVAARTVLGPSARVRFEVDAKIGAAPAASPAPAAPIAPPTAKPVIAPQPAAPAPAAEQKRGRRFADLSEMVRGGCNELAIAAALQTCDAPGERHNPLCFYGNVGLGKTHLLEGIYRRIRRNFPQLQVVYLTAEAFTNYFTEALRSHSLPSFRQRFRTVDVLLVDDVDFLDGKKMIQEEFLHTFKDLHSRGRQVVIALDRQPKLLSKTSEELTTRFVSGTYCRVEAPDLETRHRIAQRKAERLGAPILPEAVDFVAQRFKGSIRELEGALNCLSAWSTMTGHAVSASAAHRVLADLERDCVRLVHLGDVEQTVCTFFGIEPSDLKSASRSRTISHPRMLAMFLARKHTQAAYSEIGRYFGGRNHSTVMAAEKKIRGWLDSSTSLRIASRSWSPAELVEALELQLQAS